MIRIRYFIALIVCLCLYNNSNADTHPADTTKPRNLRNGIIIASATYSITMVGLDRLWYRDNGRQPFQFFNDNAEWNQMDKIGHFYSTFYLSYLADAGLQYYGVTSKKSRLVGALTAFGVMLPIEILDGFSPAYGASVGDLVANASGSALYLGQLALWDEIRIVPKWSFHRTPFAAQRPNLLGNSLITEALKDYNGQTYWFSVDMDKFMPFPHWLNLAVGYGSEGMISAMPSENNPLPYRQYYLALDLDLTGIKVRSRFLKGVFKVISVLKLPAPTLELSRKGPRLHSFYF